ncbi:MAG: XdhC family protein [Pyrinomonadaceae bacterium]
MNKELELWHFIASRQAKGEALMLLVVAESSGSSPGRAGYKMAVAVDGELCGSVGGGAMEVRLVEQARSQIRDLKFEMKSGVIPQVHRKNDPHSSGMICSGRQTLIVKILTARDAGMVEATITALEGNHPALLTVTPNEFDVETNSKLAANVDIIFEKSGDTDYVYSEGLGAKNELCIIGGGHCALALSELMSKLDFRISIFDDRPELNTLEKNIFADRISIIDDYKMVGELIHPGPNAYVVVMTLGYKTDELVIRSLFEKDLKYFGVLGSKAKMKTLMAALKKDGFSPEKLSRIRTPIGLDINSRTPEEIAVSIVAEIISVKNG